MRLAVIGGVLVLQAATACVDQGGVDVTGTSVEALGHYHDQVLPNNVPVFDGTGIATTISTTGGVDLSNEFFQDLGTNGRRCVTCHLPTAGWGTTPEQIQTIFNLTQGGVID